MEQQRGWGSAGGSTKSDGHSINAKISRNSIRIGDCWKKLKGVREPAMRDAEEHEVVGNY